MNFQQLLERYKSIRKKKYLDLPRSYRHRYAFVGVGQHSISNLYPVLQYLGVPLKLICTRHLSHAQKMAERFPGCTGTDQLEDIIQNKDIRGVFISATASQHYSIIRQFASAGKHLFIEKPPCSSLDELNNLLQYPEAGNWMPGLQKRFSTVNKLLSPQIARASSYSGRYLTGAYPEGNPVTELFIHPVDNIISLFGDIEKVEVHKATRKNKTCFVTLAHTNGVAGVLQLSTDYSWNNPVDTLEVITSSNILNAQYPFRLESTEKSGTVLGIPKEKIVKKPMLHTSLLNNTGFVPTDFYNSISLQGFLGELEYFVQAAEQNKLAPAYSLKSLVPTYQVLEKIQKVF